MQITEHKPNESTIEIMVDLERADIERDLIAAAKHLSGHIDVPGFRKGAAPYDVVARHVGGEAKVYEQALQAMVGRTLETIIGERDLDVAGNPDISITKMVPPFGVSYKAVITLLPAVALADASAIKLEKKKITPTDEEVGKILDNFREMRATESAVARPAQKGDKMVLDLEVLRDGVVIENGTSKDFPLILGTARFIPGFEEQIAGLQAGGKKEFELTFPDQYHEKSLAGKPAQFKVVVKQVLERVIPALDDAFAKQIGHSATAQELTEQVRKNLQHEKEREEQERFEMAAMDELVKQSKIGTVPEKLVDDEAHKMFGELEQNITRQGMKLDDYLGSIKKSKEDLEKEFRPKAEHRVKISLVGRAFGAQEKVRVSDEEVAAELDTMKKAYASQPELAARLGSPEYRGYVRNMLVSRKIFKTLADKVGKK